MMTGAIEVSIDGGETRPLEWEGGRLAALTRQAPAVPVPPAPPPPSRLQLAGGVQLPLVELEPTHPTTRKVPTMPVQDPSTARAAARARTRQRDALARTVERLAGEVGKLAGVIRQVESGEDAVDALAKLYDLTRELDSTRADAVTVARAYDATWADIGGAMGGMARSNAVAWYRRRMADVA